MPGNLKLHFRSVMHAYTGNVGAHLKSIEKVPLFKGSEAFHRAMSRSGIDFVHADFEAQKMLRQADGMLCSKFVNECRHVPEPSLNHSPELLEEKEHILLSALDSTFGGKTGIKVLLSNDQPRVYLLKDAASLALLKMFKAKTADPDAIKPETAGCPGPLTLALFLRGTWRPTVTAAYREKVSQHVKTCDPCGNAILKMQKKRPPKEDIIPILMEEFGIKQTA